MPWVISPPSVSGLWSSQPFSWKKRKREIRRSRAFLLSQAREHTPARHFFFFRCSSISGRKCI